VVISWLQYKYLHVNQFFDVNIYLTLLHALLAIRLHTIAANGSVTKKKLSAIAVATKRVQARYLRQLPGCKTDWPKHCVTQYVKLALVDKEDITLSDHEFTKLTLQGNIDKILKKKEPLNELIDIFHYKQKPCPWLILLMRAPGKYRNIAI